MYEEAFYRKTNTHKPTPGLNNQAQGTFLAIQWLQRHTSDARGAGSIPVGELRPHMLCQENFLKVREREPSSGTKPVKSIRPLHCHHRCSH